MNQYKNIKSVISLEEEKEYNKCSIARIIEEFYKNGEKLPKSIIDNVNFLEGFYVNYYLKLKEGNIHIEKKSTIAQNIMEKIPFEYYKEYVDINWLKTFESEKKFLINNLIDTNKYEIVCYFLDLVSKEDKEKDFKEYIFEPICEINRYILIGRNKNHQEIKKYFEVLKKGLEIYEPFYLKICKKFNQIPIDPKKWHKNYKELTIFEKNQRLRDENLKQINLFLLTNDELLDILKDVFNQYENPQESNMLEKEYLKYAVKNGSEKIVTYYISELLKNNIMTQEEIEKEIVNGLHEKIISISAEIGRSFRTDSKNNNGNTYNVEEVYNIAIKYGNYKPDYKNISELLLIDNQDFQDNFVSKIIRKEEVNLSGMKVSQWKEISDILEKVTTTTGKGLERSLKQREERYPKEDKEFVNQNPYEVIYRINRINQLFPGEENKLNERELNEVYEFFEKKIKAMLIEKNIDINKIRLNYQLENELSDKTNKKDKTKPIKI